MTGVPGLPQGFAAMLRRDVLLAFRRPGDVFNPLFFFVIVSSLFPLAGGPDAELLVELGPVSYGSRHCWRHCCP